MKKKFISGFAALLSGLLSTACLDPMASVDPVTGHGSDEDSLYTFTATLESSSTKTALDGLSVVWKAGDAIQVYNESTPGGVTYMLSAGEGQATGTFSGAPLSGGGPFYAVYPALAAGTLSAHSIPVTLPAVQSYADNSFGQFANPAWARGKALEDIRFHNACGALKLTLTGDKTIKTINIYTRGPEDYYGTLTIGALDTESPTSLFSGPLDGNGGVLTLDCGTGVALDAIGKSFFLIFPPGALAFGFQVEIIDSEGKAMLKNAPATDGNQIDRSHIRPMPSFGYVQQYKSGFLTSALLAGAWKGVKTTGNLVLCAEYSEQTGQYALQEGDTDRTVRIQNWTEGYALSLTTPGSLSLGFSVNVNVKAMGQTGGIASSGSDGTEMKVVKQFDGRTWLVDESSGNGYIIR